MRERTIALAAILAIAAVGCGAQAPQLSDDAYAWCMTHFDNHSGELGLGRNPLPAGEDGTAVERAAGILGLPGPDGGSVLDYWVTKSDDGSGGRVDAATWVARLRSDALWAQACQVAFDSK
jgi:hypothetical protein